MKTFASLRQLNAGQWIFFLAICLLGLGGIGGSLQPSRLLSICLLPFVLNNLLTRRRGPGAGMDGPTALLSGMLVLLATFSIAWSYSMTTTAGYIVVLCINLLPVLYVATLTAERRAQLVPAMLSGWAICLAITLPIAFYEFATDDHFMYAIEGRGSGGFIGLLPYASVFFGNFNDYSMFVTLCVTLVLSLSAGAAALRWRFVLVSLVFLGLAVLVINSSRGALGTALVVLFIRLIISFGPWRLLATLVVAALAVAPVFLNDDIPLAALIAFKFTDISDDLENDDGRLAIMNASLQGIIDSYGLGLGADGYSFYFRTYFPNIIPNPHNLFLELALNFGLLGLAVFVAHLVTLLRRFHVQYSRAHITGGTFALRIGPLLLLPLMGVVQSHLTGYTYFWYWYAGYILLSRIRPAPTSVMR